MRLEEHNLIFFLIHSLFFRSYLWRSIPWSSVRWDTNRAKTVIFIFVRYLQGRGRLMLNYFAKKINKTSGIKCVNSSTEKSQIKQCQDIRHWNYFSCLRTISRCPKTIRKFGTYFYIWVKWPTCSIAMLDSIFVRGLAAADVDPQLFVLLLELLLDILCICWTYWARAAWVAKAWDVAPAAWSCCLIACWAARA